ncbi:hypothetical protein ACWEFD_04455 [Streptomyces ardesiacus]
MTPTPARPGLARPAAAVNEDIRQLMLRAGGEEEREVYRRLVAEWVLAVRDEVVKAV